MTDIYKIKINSLQNKAIDLSEYKNKFILFVNVASKCGFTSQYKELEELYKTHKDNLMIIGSPCNQFGSQEPGTARLQFVSFFHYFLVFFLKFIDFIFFLK